MLKKITCWLGALAACIGSAFALTPDTASMYEKAENVALLDVSGSSKGAVYIVLALLLVFVIGAYILDRRSRKRLMEMAAQLEQQRAQRKADENE